MTPWHRTTTIASRELLDFVRDWRTILTMLLIPLLLFPLLFVVLPVVVGGQAEELAATEANVMVYGTLPTNLSDTLMEAKVNLLAPPLNSTGVDDPEQNALVREGMLDVIMGWSLGDDDVYTVHLRFMSTSSISTDARMRVLNAVSEWEDEERVRRVEAGGLDANTTLDPVRYDMESVDLASQSERQGWLLSSFIPLMFAMWMVSSAIQPSIDMTAGERERGSLEALLCAPVHRWELLAGKWAAVSIIVLTGVFLQVAGLLFALTYLAGPGLLEMPHLSLLSTVLLTVAVVCFSVMVVATELAIAIRARSVKEAGAALAPLGLLVLVPAIIVQVVNLDGVEGVWFAVPVVNVMLAMRELLLDRVDGVHTVIWLSTTLVYTLLALGYAQRQFDREDLVLGAS